MKKLMIAAAIVCAAAFAQAASFDWNVGGVALKDSDNVGMNGTIAVLVNGSTMATFNVINGAVQDATTVEFDGPATIGWKLSTTSFGDGQTWEKVVEIVGFNHPYPDAGTASSAEQSLLNANGALRNQFRGGELYFEDGASAAMDGGWSVAPEPTSGLLLLIGVAGLALRRRRA